MKKYLLLLFTFSVFGCSFPEKPKAAECADCNQTASTVIITNFNEQAKQTSKATSSINLTSLENVKPVSVPVAVEKKQIEQAVTSSAKDASKEIVISKTAPTANQQIIEPKLAIVAQENQIEDTEAFLFPEQDELSFSESLAVINKKIKQVWGDDGFVRSSKHRLVKYFDAFTSRADIHFDSGKIVISTISSNGSLEKLQKAIVQTLLMPANPNQVDVLGSDAIKLGSKPFFFGQILDHEGKNIEWEWRANRFANYLIQQKLKQKSFIKGKVNYVEIDLVENHLDLRQSLFANLVSTAASQYEIPENLINAVIKTESSFNPYAISNGGAFGLMQVIPQTAGADVFLIIKKREDIPTQEYLLDPQNNIDTGVAYLHILFTKYLRQVADPSSKQFAVISAYNSGTGGVLSTFDLDRSKAISIINQTNPRQVYDLLTTSHPSKEARNYLIKVLKSQKDFSLDKV